MTAMHLRVAGVLSFCVVLWHWCNGQNIPEDLPKDNITPPNTFGQENPTNKTMDQLLMEAMGGLKNTLNVKDMHDGILMELDMLLSKQQYYSLYEQRNSSTLIRSKRKAVRNPILRWPNGVIPYRFYPGHFSQGDQDMVRQAMKEWERNTCLRFREATSSDINLVVFTNGSGCFSMLGMVGGEQTVSLSSARCRYRGVYLHEIGHAIGLMHEHNRPDRDDYVEIIRENVQTGLFDQFTKYTSQDVDQMNVPYDYYSVMHYSVTAFSKAEGLKTIIVKHPVNEASVGNLDTKKPSFRDLEIVNKMYKCHAKCDPSIQCSGGYVDKNCQCVCKNDSHGCQIGGGIQPSGCINLYNDVQCDIWAACRECDKKPSWMLVKCRKSCGQCNNNTTNTPTTKRSTSTVALSSTTKNSTQTGCQNKHINSIYCDYWAREDECEMDPLWMITNCQKSCRACEKPILTQAPAIIPAPDIGEVEPSYPDVEIVNKMYKCYENGTQIWVIAVVIGLIVAIVIIVTVIVVRKRRFTRNEYEVPVNRSVHDRQSNIYTNLNLPPPT